MELALHAWLVVVLNWKLVSLKHAMLGALQLQRSRRRLSIFFFSIWNFSRVVDVMILVFFWEFWFYSILVLCALPVLFNFGGDLLHGILSWFVSLGATFVFAWPPLLDSRLPSFSLVFLPRFTFPFSGPFLWFPSHSTQTPTPLCVVLYSIFHSCVSCLEVEFDNWFGLMTRCHLSAPHRGGRRSPPPIAVQTRAQLVARVTMDRYRSIILEVVQRAIPMWKINFDREKGLFLIDMLKEKLEIESLM